MQSKVIFLSTLSLVLMLCFFLLFTLPHALILCWDKHSLPGVYGEPGQPMYCTVVSSEQGGGQALSLWQTAVILWRSQSS